jgi:hypothetical protein
MLVVADGTRKLLGNLFELEDLGLKELKGISKPARAWAAIRPSSVESRFEALHATDMTALVGRERETDSNCERNRQCQEGLVRTKPIEETVNGARNSHRWNLASDHNTRAAHRSLTA